MYFLRKKKKGSIQDDRLTICNLFNGIKIHYFYIESHKEIWFNIKCTIQSYT